MSCARPSRPLAVKGIMVDLPTLLEGLSKERPLFHSEADFQHALAWRIQVIRPNAHIRLEYRPAVAGRPHLDIWASTADENLAVEVKYKTRAIDCEVGGESYLLTSHSAQDQGRYDFWKDVGRLERVAREIPRTTGLALLLTNDSALWKISMKANSVDAAFRLDEGRTLTGNLQWGAAAGASTKRGRETLLEIRGTYGLAWRDYSQVPSPRYKQFKYLLVTVLPVPKI
jgi:hypothetical protein